MKATGNGWRIWVLCLAALMVAFSVAAAVVVLDNGIEALEAASGTSVEPETKSAADAERSAKAAEGHADAAAEEAGKAAEQAEAAQTAAERAAAAAPEARAPAQAQCPCPCAQGTCTAAATPQPQATPAAAPAATQEQDEKPEGQSTAADLLIPLIGLVFGFASLGVILVARSAPDAPLPPGPDLLAAYDAATRAHTLATQGAAKLAALEKDRKQEKRSPVSWSFAQAVRAQAILDVFQRAGLAAEETGRLTAQLVPAEAKKATDAGEETVKRAEAGTKALEIAADKPSRFEAVVEALENARDKASAAAKAAAVAAREAGAPPEEPPADEPQEKGDKKEPTSG